MEYIETLRTNKNNAFWNDVSWIILQKQIKPQSISDILCTNLWNNRSLKIDRKTIFYIKWYNKKIHFIKDILDETGAVLNYNTFVNKYDLRINFMEYFGVKSVVESFIRNSQIVISNLIITNCYIPFNIKEIIKNKKGCKDIYNILNENIIV